VAILETFVLAFFSVASARGQWKSPFPLTVILEPPVEIAFPLAVENRQWKCYFHWRFVLFSRQWKFSRLFLNFQSVLKFIYIYTHKHIY
jgi:hypothetical protein